MPVVNSPAPTRAQADELSDLLQLRLSGSQKQRIRVAAAYRGTSMSDFVRDAALSVAEADERERITSQAA